LDEVKALKSYRDAVGRTRPLKRFFQDKKASELLPSDITSYQYWRREQKARHNKSVCTYNVSNASVNREVAIIKRCFNLAIRERLLEKNPCVGVKPLKEKERNRICSREEFEALKAELTGDAQDIVVIAYHTGMRYSEIVMLEWNRVDFKNRLIHLRGVDTKNGEPRKVPFLSKEVDEVLVLRGGNPRRIHGRVFGVKSIRNAFERACRKLGIKDLRIHDFRHTAATNMRKAGIDTTTIMKICGWKSVQMFLRYNEVDDSDIQKASAAIAQVERKLLTSATVSG
jgi:integrase